MQDSKIRKTFYFSILILLFPIGVLLITGSAQKKPLTRSDWLQMTTCEFKGKTVDEVLSAAEKVLILSDDSSDISFYHLPNKMGGSRKYNFYAVFVAGFGQYNFDVTATQNGDDVKAQLFIGHSSQTIAPTPTYTPGVSGGAGGIGVTAAPGPITIGQPLEWGEIYELFFLRMKSILNGGKWYTCEEASKLLCAEILKQAKEDYEKAESEATSNMPPNNSIEDCYKLQALCFNADDKKPD